MFTIKGALSPVLYVITDIFDRDGETFVTGSACGGIFTCEVLLSEIEEY